MVILNPSGKKVNGLYKFREASSRDDKHDYFLAQLQSGEGEIVDFILEKNNKIKASITFSISNNEAISLPKAPFGGIWCDEKIGSAALEDFILTIVGELKERKISFVSITQAPKPYVNQSNLINYLFFKNGFTQCKVLFHQFYIGKKKIKKLVDKIGAESIRKRKKAGLTTTHHSIGNFEFLKQIRKWNEKRGYLVAVDENLLIHQVSLFPERYFLINLQNDNEIVGLALAVRLTSTSLYYAMSAINPQFNISHGGELIVGELFKLAAKLSVDFIDLGSSDLESGANHNLIFFKSKFSNDSSNKIVWTKEL